MNRRATVVHALLDLKAAADIFDFEQRFADCLRLRRGLELLKNSDLPVAEVAYQVGFSDPAYFSRTFSQEFGFAPKESRK